MLIRLKRNHYSEERHTELSRVLYRERFWFTRLESVNEKVCSESLPLSLDYFTQNDI